MDAYYNLTISSSAYKFKCSMLTSLYKRKYSSNSHELLFYNAFMVNIPFFQMQELSMRKHLKLTEDKLFGHNITFLTITDTKDKRFIKMMELIENYEEFSEKCYNMFKQHIKLFEWMKSNNLVGIEINNYYGESISIYTFTYPIVVWHSPKYIKSVDVFNQRDLEDRRKLDVVCLLYTIFYNTRLFIIESGTYDKCISFLWFSKKLHELIETKPHSTKDEWKKFYEELDLFMNNKENVQHEINAFKNLINNHPDIINDKIELINLNKYIHKAIIIIDRYKVIFHII